MTHFQLLRGTPRTRPRPYGGRDAVAAQVMAAPSDRLQRQCSDCAQSDKPGSAPVEAEQQDEALQRKESTVGEATLAGSQAAAITRSQGAGQPLPTTEQHFFSRRMGADFSNVRVHQDAQTNALFRSLSARAFTVGRDLYFGPGEYQPSTADGRRLIAHELTHVMQQRQGGADRLRRMVELRPPGRGEASAFERAGDLIARLNSLSQGLVYALDGQGLRCEVVDESQLSVFDGEMKALTDRDEVLPMRLINQSGHTEASPGSGYEPVVQDTWTRACVDLDDLLASDNLGFKTLMMHILTERAEARSCAQRIGSPHLTVQEYDRAHGLAHQAEERVPAETYALDKKGRRMTIEELIVWRQQNTAGGGSVTTAPAHASAPVPPAAPAPSPAPAPGPAPAPQP